MAKRQKFSLSKNSLKRLYLGQNQDSARQLNADFFPILTLQKLSLSTPNIRRLFHSIPLASHALITSPSSAKLFAQTSKKFHVWRYLKNLQYLSIGEKTSASLKKYISPSLSIKESSYPIAESLADIISELPQNISILYPSSSLARSILLKALNTHCITYKHCFLYKMAPNKLPIHYLNHYDEFLFTSPSGVKAYAKYHPFLEHKKYLCIGRITAQELQKHHSHFALFN